MDKAEKLLSLILVASEPQQQQADTLKTVIVKVVLLFASLRGSAATVFQTLIKDFDAKDSTPFEMVDKLLHDPEVLRSSTKLNVIPTVWTTGSVRLERASLSFSERRLCEAMNEIVLSTERAGWVAF